MNRVATFQKVSFEQFHKDMCDTFSLADDGYVDTVRLAYNAVSEPVRKTTKSAGYDFVSPLTFDLVPGDSITIPTGIRAFIEDGWWLAILPRSSLGFKYRLQLDNTTGCIDADYAFSDNEGHIFIKLTNDSKDDQVVHIDIGDRFAQGIFLPFGITFDDEATATRNGGMGSTGR